MFADFLDRGIGLQIGSSAMLVAYWNTSELLFIELDVPPMIVDNRTLVPLRAISEALGAEVDWCGDTQTVTITTAINDADNAQPETKRVGNADFGFITVPSDWVEFIIEEWDTEHIGFRDSDGFEILLINRGLRSSSAPPLRQTMMALVPTENPINVEIAGFAAYRGGCAYRRSDNTYHYRWFFIDGDNISREIVALIPAARVAEAIEIVENTFSFE